MMVDWTVEDMERAIGEIAYQLDIDVLERAKITKILEDARIERYIDESCEH